MTQDFGGVVYVGPVERGARAAARRLSHDYGAHIALEVEAALGSVGPSRRAEQYLDPVALAALVISAAQLSWSVYMDLRSRKAKPAREVIERIVTVKLPERSDISTTDRERVITVVTEEIVRQAEAPSDP
jgi:hypothetical protein